MYSRRCFVVLFLCLAVSVGVSAATNRAAASSTHAHALTTNVWRGLNVYYLRHGEMMGNIASRYEKMKPEERPPNWNSYSVFSELGVQQVSNIVKTLKGYHFDVIVVSPTWRTKQTILPYLKAHHRLAEIWPELTEISGARTPADNERATADIMFGPPLVIERDETQYFRARGPAVTNLCKAANTYTDARTLTAASARLLTERYGNSGLSVLVVGHSVAGGALLRYMAQLTSDEKFWLRNASVSQLRQQPDGTFALVMVNGEAWRPSVARSAP